MSSLSNVKADIRGSVAQDKLASQFSDALSGMFTIEHHKRNKAYGKTYITLHCKATRTVAESLLLEREVLAILLNVDDVQVRTLHFAKERISEADGRLDPSIVLIVHSDVRGDEKLRTWGREQGLKVIPIFRPKTGALPTSEVLRRHLAQDLFSLDPFQVTGPVISDGDFFGRRNDAIEQLRQLQSGRIKSLFGIRKVGKTSLINRVVNLAREAGTPKIAMIDCSVDEFNKLNAAQALKAIAKVAKLAVHRGYAHITDALKKSDSELVPVFDDLWAQEPQTALALIFDEVDYITPGSPTRSHWRTDFNPFWREFRVVYQEAQRRGGRLSVLVSGVSSYAFRVESFNEIENSVLHFVPEEYLSPFAREASKAMLKDLSKRCGLVFSDSDLDSLAEACGDFPYWMRMAGSYFHRAVEVQGRPVTVAHEVFSQLLNEFLEAEGAELAQVALEDLGRKSKDTIDLLRKAASVPSIPLADGKLLTRYGLAKQRASNVMVKSAMIKKALELTPTERILLVQPIDQEAKGDKLTLETAEWAEELSVISRRRNLIERKLREFVHFALKLSSKKGENWTDKVLKALPEKQRIELSSLLSLVM